MHLTKPKRQVKCIFRIKRHGEKQTKRSVKKVLKKRKSWYPIRKAWCGFMKSCPLPHALDTHGSRD